MVIDVVKLEMHHFTNITWSHDRWVTWLDGCSQLNLSHTLLKLVTIVLANLLIFQWPLSAEIEIKHFLNITWSHDQWVTWLVMSNTLILNQKVYCKSNRTQQQKYMCIRNWGKLVLQIEATLFYYKLGQLHYCKLGQVLLQIGAAITN